jgi:hypothetical protein
MIPSLSRIRIDGNRENNRLDNLALVESSEHVRIHRRFKLE